MKESRLRRFGMYVLVQGSFCLVMATLVGVSAIMEWDNRRAST